MHTQASKSLQSQRIYYKAYGPFWTKGPRLQGLCATRSPKPRRGALRAGRAPGALCAWRLRGNWGSFRAPLNGGLGLIQGRFEGDPGCPENESPTIWGL